MGSEVKFAKLFKAFGAMALSASVFATPAHAEWLEARSKHFIITGDTTEGTIRNRAERLEQFDAALRYLLGTKDEGVKVHLFLLHTMGDVQELADNRYIGGWYSANAQQASAFMPMKVVNAYEGFDAEGILFHEYTHHMLLGSTTAFIPRWATEGLAELFMTAKLDRDGSVTIGAGNPSRQYAIRSMHRWTVEEMLRRDAEDIKGEEMIERYSRGWALCHYLWMSGNRPGQYVKFIELLNKYGDEVKAGKEAFGDLTKLDHEVDAYIRRSSFPVSRLPADKIKASTEVSIRPMTAGEVAMINLRMASAAGVDDEKAASVYARALPVAQEYPKDLAVQRWFAEMALDAKHFGHADQAADRALAVDPKDLKSLAFKGRVVAHKALETGSAADWKAARSWFLRANRSDPNDPYPFELYYDSFPAAGQKAPDDAVTGLFRAVMVMPQDGGLRIRSALELLRLNDIPKARTILAPVVYDPHATSPFTKLVKDMDAGKSAKDLLKEAHELKLDGYNELIPPKKDDDDKKDGKGGDSDKKGA